MGYGIAIEFSPAAFEQFDKQLAALPMLGRMPAIKGGLRGVGKTVERQLVATLPMPGYPGDKPGKTPLRETVQSKVKEYPSGKVVLVVGYNYSGGGQHGHLVEEGHRQVAGGKVARKGKKTDAAKHAGRVVGTVEGRHYLRKAIQATESQQESAMEAGIAKAIQETEKSHG